MVTEENHLNASRKGGAKSATFNIHPHLTPIHKNSLNFKSQSLDFLSKNPDFGCGTDVNTGTSSPPGLVHHWDYFTIGTSSRLGPPHHWD